MGVGLTTLCFVVTPCLCARPTMNGSFGRGSKKNLVSLSASAS